MPKSARINFGIPDSEYIVKVDDSGAATSCYNQDTDTEYVGGGGGGDFTEITITLNVDTASSEIGFVLQDTDNGFLWAYIKSGSDLIITPDYYELSIGQTQIKIYLANEKSIIAYDILGTVNSTSGAIQEMEGYYSISGDCTLNITGSGDI